MSDAGANVQPSTDKHERSVYLILTLIIQLILLTGLTIFLLRRDWENVFYIAIVILLTLVPAFLFRRYRIIIPPEFQFFAALFMFVSLYLGSVRGMYDRFWWWDIVLHTSSGFLLGIVGFLSIFLLNHTNRIPRGTTPLFICFFAVTFAVFLGVLWEIFEYACDRLLKNSNMQSIETGPRDTMQDLIVDTIGALVVAAMGWAYLKRGRYSFLANSIRRFIARNPKLFRPQPPTQSPEPSS